MSKFHNREKSVVLLNKAFIQDLRISFEAKGYYVGYESGKIEFQEIPEDIRKEITDWFDLNGGV